MRKSNSRQRARRAKAKAKAKQILCPDCGSVMVDGGYVGHYCTKPGCDHDTLKGAMKDMRIARVHLHDTPEDTPQFKEDLEFETALTDQLVVMQVAYPTTWACQETRMSMLDLQRLLRLIGIYRLRADARAKDLSDLTKSKLSEMAK